MGPTEQQRVDACFGAEAGFWRDVYQHDSLDGAIYRRRLDIALDWIERFGPPPPARILEIGSGGGLLAVALSERGHLVCAVDSSAEMVLQTQAGVTSALGARDAVTGRCAPFVTDAHDLGAARGSFDVVVALGLLPWLHTPQAALDEMARVVRGGGLVVVTADNRDRLTHLLDPRISPPLEPVREAVKRGLVRAKVRGARAAPDVENRRDLPSEIDRMLSVAGLSKIADAFAGFGPFTLLGRPVLPEPLGVSLNGVLQGWADSGRRLVRGRGSQYLVAARRAGAGADLTGLRTGGVSGSATPSAADRIGGVPSSPVR